MAPGPDQALHVGLRQRLQHRPGDGAQEVPVTGLLQQPGQWRLSSVIGSSVQGKLATPP